MENGLTLSRIETCEKILVRCYSHCPDASDRFRSFVPGPGMDAA
jgi:hypothetical protein